MQFPSITELIQRLTADAEFRERFSRNSSEAIESLHLQPAERRSLLRMQARLAVPSGVIQYEAGPLTGWP